MAEVLDLLVEKVEARRDHRGARCARLRICHGPWRDPGAAQLSRLSEIDLHLAEPRGLPRHPGTAPLKEGDILNIDVTLIVDGWHGDSSRMYGVGKIAARRRAPARGHL